MVAVVDPGDIEKVPSTVGDTGVTDFWCRVGRSPGPVPTGGSVVGYGRRSNDGRNGES